MGTLRGLLGTAIGNSAILAIARPEQARSAWNDQTGR